MTRHLHVMQRLQPRKLKGVRWTRPRVVRPTNSSNTYWEMDLTYVWCGSGFGYLFAVIDAYDKGIPGAHFGDRCRAVEAAQALEEAAKSLNVTLEYAGIQCPDDKPYIESFFGHYKTEEVYRSSYATLAEGQVGWSLYRIWYETERVHESLGYHTPHQRLSENGSGRLRFGTGGTHAHDESAEEHQRASAVAECLVCRRRAVNANSGTSTGRAIPRPRSIRRSPSM